MGIVKKMEGDNCKRQDKKKAQVAQLVERNFEGV